MDETNKKLLDQAFMDDLHRNESKIRDEEMAKVSGKPSNLKSPKELNKKVEERTEARVKEEQVVQRVEAKTYGESGENQRLTNELYQFYLRKKYNNTNNSIVKVRVGMALRNKMKQYHCNYKLCFLVRTSFHPISLFDGLSDFSLNLSLH